MTEKRPRLVLDMVHHNPGEPPFKTRFSDPEHLLRYGYNGQVFKHINCLATFPSLGGNFFPEGSDECKWLCACTKKIEAELRDAKGAGLLALCHIDLFVLPRRLVEKYQSQLCDHHGRISVDCDFTLEVHRLLFAEIFERYPELDGFVIRHGETYLYDTPFHTGNGPVAWHPPFAEPTLERSRFVRLIQFLREEICVRHNKTLIFRTWDYLDNRFHADPEYYLDVTTKISPHENLTFSIKHTKLDFFRHVMVNPSLGLGDHLQIIEVQCQREYEGKGAYPNYIGQGVIEGFPENSNPRGLNTLLHHPNCRGIFTWSRGGGWYGPYIPHELWCDLNAWVVAGFASGRGSEPELLDGYGRKVLKLKSSSLQAWRDLCRLSSEAVRCGRYCTAYDQSLGESHVPVNLWMRDDRLGGWTQLAPVFAYLREHELVARALEEKQHSVELWNTIVSLSEALDVPDSQLGEFIRTSCLYGQRLYALVAAAWEVHANPDEVSLRVYYEKWNAYKVITQRDCAASPYKPVYFSMPGAAVAPGLQQSIQAIEKMIYGSAPQRADAVLSA